VDNTVNNSKKELSFSKSILWISFANILGRLLAFISGIVVARILCPDDFGIISMAATFSGFIEFTGNMGIEAFLISRTEISKEQINTVYLLNIIIGFLFGLIMVLASGFVADIYKTPEVKNILYFSGLSFFAVSFGAVPRAILLKQMRQDITSKIEITRNFLNVSLVIIFALSGFKYLSYVIPLLISNVITVCLYNYAIKWKFVKLWNKDFLLQAVSYAKSFLPKSVLGYIVFNSDYIFVGWLLGKNLLGYYYFGFEKAFILIVFTTSLMYSTFFPVFSNIQKDKEKLQKTFFSLIEKSSFFLYPLIFIQIFMAKEFIDLIYGHKWDNSVLTFQLILCYCFSRVVVLIISILFDSTGRPEQNLRHYLIATPVCAIFFLAGTYFGGLKGVSIAAFIAHSICAILLYIRVSKVFDWNFTSILVKSLKAFMPILAMLPVLIFLRAVLINKVSDLLMLIIITLASFTLYLYFTKLLLNNIYISTFLPIKQKMISKINVFLIKEYANEEN